MRLAPFSEEQKPMMLGFLFALDGLSRPLVAFSCSTTGFLSDSVAVVWFRIMFSEGVLVAIVKLKACVLTLRGEQTRISFS